MSRQTKSRPLASPLVRSAAQAFCLSVLPGDATIIQSFPKSGSSWLKAMLAQAVLGSSQPVENVDALVPSTPANLRSKQNRFRLPLSLVRTHEPRRVPAALFSQRAIQLVRDPVDVAFSYQSQLKFQSIVSGDQLLEGDEFVSAFLTGNVGDGYGRWDENVRSWAVLPQECLLRIRYRDLIENPTEQLGRALDFIGVARPTRVVEAICSQVGEATELDARFNEITGRPFNGRDLKMLERSAFRARYEQDFTAAFGPLAEDLTRIHL